MSNNLALVIPVYNEESCIEQVILDWGNTIEKMGIPFNIIVVNDGSKDETPNILDNLAKEHPELTVIHQENQGHGIAVKVGYIEAIHKDYDFIFQTDSDNQFTPEDFSKLWEQRHFSQAVFGVREHRKDPPHRKIVSFFLRKSLFDFFQVDIPDANIPYRLFEKSYLKKALACLTPGIFAPNIFLSILSFKSLKECPVVPVQHFAREGEAKLVSWSLIKACFKSVWDLIVFSYQLNAKIQYMSDKTQEEHIIHSSYEKNQNVAA